ncbi:MAG TPA: hypothetical protein VFH99_01065 [Candidatus Saccharimonadales bacterium]|nr:hypothetical protein [Candidatus Saccharimonadales bacterium]
MNPSSSETPGTPGISLPPPVAEQAPDTVKNASSTPERQAAAPEMAPSPAAAQPAATPAPVAPAPSQAAAQTGAASTTPAPLSPVLEDDDKVEKEWVGKAKRIVEQTRHDPYRESEELTVVKADYMKQRYNKIIKVEK